MSCCRSYGNSTPTDPPATANNTSLRLVKTQARPRRRGSYAQGRANKRLRSASRCFHLFLRILDNREEAEWATFRGWFLAGQGTQAAVVYARTGEDLNNDPTGVFLVTATF